MKRASACSPTQLSHPCETSVAANRRNPGSSFSHPITLSDISFASACESCSDSCGRCGNGGRRGRIWTTEQELTSCMRREEDADNKKKTTACLSAKNSHKDFYLLTVDYNICTDSRAHPKHGLSVPRHCEKEATSRRRSSGRAISEDGEIDKSRSIPSNGPSSSSPADSITLPPHAAAALTPPTRPSFLATGSRTVRRSSSRPSNPLLPSPQYLSV